MKTNETLEVLADDPAAESDIRSLVKELKHEIFRVTRKHTHVKWLYRRNHSSL